MTSRPIRKITPKPTTATDFRVPDSFNKYTSSLDGVPTDGEWYIMAEAQGLSTAEQTARSLNRKGSDWIWGYHVRSDNGVLVSDLAVRFVGTTPNP